MRRTVLGTALLIGLFLPSNYELESVSRDAASEQSRDLLCFSTGCQRQYMECFATSVLRNNGRHPFEDHGWVCFMDPGNLPFGRCVWWEYPIRGYARQPPGIVDAFLPKCASIDCVSPAFRRGAL